ncbi:MAG: DUF695 domain-containing protein [Campylobacterales bacterium]|nr:DUF695 domain-containing protein [Campylobacterales bacterium]
MQWILKPTDNINQMLKIRSDLENIANSEYPMHIALIHHYTTRDDLLFPEAMTLAFFEAFKEQLDTLNDAILVAEDINMGLLTLHIYAKAYQKTIEECIGYLKKQPHYDVEFKVTHDLAWAIVKAL